MKKLFFIGFLLCGFLFTNAFAESAPLQITEGRFFIPFGNESVRSDAQFSTSLFSASSYLGGYYSPWYEVCGPSQPRSCQSGRTFTTPQNSVVYVGGCIGCSGPQFPAGTFKINGVTYENARFSGEFRFSQETFSIPRILKRKGSMGFRKPFRMTGNLKVCSIQDPNYNCPADKVVFDGQISGGGELTVTMKINRADSSIGNFYYLTRQSFEYQFTK